MGRSTTYMAELVQHHYRPEIDGLRAIAVSSVIVYHVNNELLPGGFLGVDIFFVISGYVITAMLAKQDQTSIVTFLVSFYSRRIKRLIPALVVCVLITSLLGTLFIDPQSTHHSHSIKAGFLSLFGLSNLYFFKNATDYFGTSAQLNLFIHTWSLGVEEQFYLVFPALFWAIGCATRRVTTRKLLIAALGFLSILSFWSYIQLNNEAMNAGAYFLLPSRLWELGIGCIAANTHWRPVIGYRFAPWLALAVLAIALCVRADLQLYSTPMAVIGTAALITTLSPEGGLYQLLTTRCVLLVGLMSYSLYLWHWSILTLSRWTVGVDPYLLPIELGMILSFAATSYVFIERPLRQLEWSASKLKTIGFGLAASLCCTALMVCLNSWLKDLIYTGNPARMVAKGVESLANDKWYAGEPIWHARACILSSDDEVGKRINVDLCTLALPAKPVSSISSKPQFLVVGNSFSAAEFEMVSALAEEDLGSVVVTSSWGASPVAEVPNKSPWAAANTYYWTTVVPRLISQLHRGDFLIMIDDLDGFAPAKVTSDDEDRLILLSDGLKRLAEDLHTRGVQMIFQSHNPFIRESECTPDNAKVQWFHVRHHVPCNYYSKTYSLKRLQRLNAELESVRNTNPNFHILDLFPVLCSEDVCRFSNKQGVLLYRDEFSHMSVEANYLARPLFRAVVDKASMALKASEHQRATALVGRTPPNPRSEPELR
jgi:peptidoglycan/LPS O-acetylase OafA/YrhL